MFMCRFSPIKMWRASTFFCLPFNTFPLGYGYLNSVSFLPDHPVHYKHVSHQSHHTDERVESRDANVDDKSSVLVGLVARNGDQILRARNIERSYGDRVVIVREKSGKLHCGDPGANRAQRFEKYERTKTVRQIKSSGARRMWELCLCASPARVWVARASLRTGTSRPFPWQVLTLPKKTFFFQNALIKNASSSNDCQS